MDPEQPPRRYVFSMDKWTPKTIPARRFAQYVDRLATLLGTYAAVHFDKITKGSARPAFNIDANGAKAVYERVKAANDGGNTELMAIRKEVNKMLQDDGNTGYLQADPGPKIIIFPGRKTPISEEVVVLEAGSIDGMVMRVGGRDSSVPLSIETSDGIYHKCTVTRALAKQLAPYLFDGEVRLFGSGRWQRNQDGEWKLLAFDVKNFDRLQDDKFSEFIADMRNVTGSGWNEMVDPQALLRQIREG